MQGRENDLAGLDATVLAISTDDRDGARNLTERVGIRFPVLYDPQAKVISEWGVYNLLGDRLATPSTFVVDKSGRVRWSYIGKSSSDEPSPDTILRQLRAIQSQP